jgi:hypothetical protein
MPKTIEIPKVGTVQFPDEMSDQEIVQASDELHSKALADAVSKFMEADPTIQTLKTSEKHKALASIAAMLENYPLLAQAVDTGMDQLAKQNTGVK